MKGGGDHGSRWAVGAGDLLHARLGDFNARVQRSLATIREAATLGRICVSFSGGKDSTVLLDLVRQIDPSAPAVWFDSGAELASTRELCITMGCLVIEPAMTVQQCWRIKGYGGCVGTDPDARIDLQEILIDEPARRALSITGCAVSAIGLRMDESRGRRMSGIVHGELLRQESCWRLCPLIRWTVADIWAYIASRDLAYNRAYDVMAQRGIPRERQRISTLLDAAAAHTGRYVYLKVCEPDTFNELAAEFPKVRAYA